MTGQARDLYCSHGRQRTICGDCWGPTPIPAAKPPDTDDATIEEAKNHLGTGVVVGHDGQAEFRREVSKLCDIATRRGERIKELGALGATLVKANTRHFDRARALLVERDALAEENRKLREQVNEAARHLQGYPAWSCDPNNDCYSECSDAWHSSVTSFLAALSGGTE
jgi:hypothetical protein